MIIYKIRPVQIRKMKVTKLINKNFPWAAKPYSILFRCSFDVLYF